MSEPTLKILIPMAGLGKRLRPHTWSKPKQLVSVAGKTVIDHVIASLSSYPNFENIELINIIGYLGELAKAHIQENYPHLRSRFVYQDEPHGQSHAIFLAREHLQGPLLVVFADTLIETNLAFLLNEVPEAMAWVKTVPDPRRFGVAELGEDGCVKRLIEKPDDKINNLAVVGFYYFNDGSQLISAIEEQMKRNLQIKGEFFLADAINILLERGTKMQVNEVDVWLDAGTPQALLETNRYFLDHGHDNSGDISSLDGAFINQPVFIHPTAVIENTIIGPYVSIGSGCKIKDSVVRNSIIEDQVQLEGMILHESLVGSRTELRQAPNTIMIGGDSRIEQ